MTKHEEINIIKGTEHPEEFNPVVRKQEEIRGHLIELFEQTPADEVAGNLVDAVLWVLNEDGVVIKTDRELPDYLMEGQEACDKPTYQEMLRRAGYVAVEPLVEK